MANVQYIGARYVPKFFENPDDHSNDWKAGELYEALMIVTYNNDSYTSKRVVPETVGNPADNPSYWACTTKYTAALMALQSTVANQGDSIDALQLKVDKIISPDDYDGTDAQKLQQALDAAMPDGVVCIDRTYTISDQLYLKNAHDDMLRVSVIGIGKTAKIVSTTPLLFSAVTGENACGYVFSNITFIGSGSNIFLSDEEVTRITFNYCTFKNFLNVINSATICQQFQFNFCLFAGNTGAVADIDAACYCLTFFNCYMEGGYALIKHNAVRGGANMINTTVEDCVIEGATYTPITIAGIRGLVIRNNYFENNAVDYNIDLTESAVSRCIDISNNIIYSSNDNVFICLPAYSNQLIGRIAYNNKVTGYMYFVKDYPDVPHTLRLNSDFNDYANEFKPGGRAITVIGTPDKASQALVDNLSANLVCKTVKPEATTGGAWTADVFDLPTPTEYATYAAFNAATGAITHVTKRANGDIFPQDNLLNNFYNITGINK